MNLSRRATIIATAVVVVVMSTLLILLGIKAGRDTAQPTPAPTTAVTTPAGEASQLPKQTNTATSSATTGTSGAASTPPPPTEEGAPTSADEPKLLTAKGFMEAWLTRGTPDQRAKALAPYALDSEIETAKLVDPSKLPDGPVTELVVDPRIDGNTARVFATLKDGTKWGIVMVLTPAGKHGWKVKYIEGD